MALWEGRQELKLAEVSKQVHQDNRLLAALPHDALAEVSRELRQVSLVQGKALFEPGAPLDEIYFPQSGMISLMVVTSDGRAVEISTIGREGAVGLHGALGARILVHARDHANRRQIFDHSGQQVRTIRA